VRRLEVLSRPVTAAATTARIDWRKKTSPWTGLGHKAEALLSPNGQSNWADGYGEKEKELGYLVDSAECHE
jgi:hypothetical protein